MSKSIRATGFAFLLSCTVLAQAPLPPAPARRIVTISPPNSRANEPSIAIDPNNPNQVIAAFQSATISYSTDGARSFSIMALPTVDGYPPGGADVSLAFDDKGRVYLSSLHYEKLGSASYWAHGAGKNGIFVRRSLDAGKTWESNAVAVRS